MAAGYYNIQDIYPIINTECSDYELIKIALDYNKQHLIDFYSNRIIFNEKGYTICVVTQKICNLSNFATTDRDNRIDIQDNDIQLGHNRPRSDTYVSICGENLLPMSRRGNLIIGENLFTENLWIEELKRIMCQYLT